MTGRDEAQRNAQRIVSEVEELWHSMERAVDEGESFSGDLAGDVARLDNAARLVRERILRELSNG